MVTEADAREEVRNNLSCDLKMLKALGTSKIVPVPSLTVLLWTPLQSHPTFIVIAASGQDSELEGLRGESLQGLGLPVADATPYANITDGTRGQSWRPE